MPRIYQANPKHKPGQSFGDPPRYFPDHDTPCPTDISLAFAQKMLEQVVEFEDKCTQAKKVGCIVDEQGRFFKGFTHIIQGDEEFWHGFFVRPGRIKRDIPAKALKKLKDLGKISEKQYRELI